MGLISDLAEREAAKARKSLAEFVKQAWSHVRPGDPLRWGWHIDAICEHLEAVTRGDIRRLLITICPGSAKSLLVEVFWPAWMWANDPTKELVCLASDGDLALRDAGRQRELIACEWYQRSFAHPAQWGLHPSENAKHLFKTTRGGVRYSAGVNGSVTGWRGHGVIMDDLLQAKDVRSAPARDTAIWQLNNAIQTRINDPSTGFFVMMQQRLCVGDPAEWAINRGDYVHLNIPTEFVPARACITYRQIDVPANGIPAHKASVEMWRDPRAVAGELMFPAFFTPEVVAEAKKNPEMFAAQHQQDPMPPGGGMFKKADWRFWRHADRTEKPPERDATWNKDAARVLPKMSRILISCDATFRKTVDGSRVAIHVWGLAGADRFLLERVWDRMDFNGTETALMGVIARWPAAREKVIEGKANGDGLIARLRDVRKVAGVFEGKPGDGDKVERANAMLPYVAGGNVFLPEHAPWLADYITEHALFPGPCHLGNDDVDAQSQALSHLEESAPTFSYNRGAFSTPEREDD